MIGIKTPKEHVAPFAIALIIISINALINTSLRGQACRGYSSHRAHPPSRTQRVSTCSQPPGQYSEDRFVVYTVFRAAPPRRGLFSDSSQLLPPISQHSKGNRECLRAARGSGHAQSTIIAFLGDDLVVEDGCDDDASAGEGGTECNEQGCGLHFLRSKLYVSVVSRMWLWDVERSADQLGRSSEVLRETDCTAM